MCKQNLSFTFQKANLFDRVNSSFYMLSSALTIKLGNYKYY